MKKKLISILLITLSLSGFISCRKQSPQLPSNKGNVPDKNTAIMLDINQELALKEDNIIKCLAEKDKAFRKNELGFWYKIDQKSTGAKLKEKDVCKFSCKMELLNGKILKTDIRQVVIGKKELVVGLEEGLKLMHKGESATFIVPSYLGYGMKGNPPLVKAFTSLIFKIKLYE